MKLVRFVLAFGLVCFLFLNHALAIDFPQPLGYVNDFAGIFSEEFKIALEKDLVEFEEQTSVEIAVVSVNSLAGTTIEDYAVRLFESWKIGKANEDNGLLLLIAPNERELRIEVGYGLEPVITDGRSGRIIREEITPEFKEGDYDAGVRKGIDRIQEFIRSGAPPVPTEETLEKAADNFGVVIIFLLILIYLSSFWGRTKRFWPGGVVGAVLGLLSGLILGALVWRIFLTVFFGAFGLLLDLILSRNYKKRKKIGQPTGWWKSGGGFFGSGGSSGGGGFGGFSGGSSGGGGASGSW